MQNEKKNFFPDNDGTGGKMGADDNGSGENFGRR